MRIAGVARANARRRRPNLRARSSARPTSERTRARHEHRRAERHPTGARTERRARHADRVARPAEPILLPKVRIRFAEFPSLIYAVGQRLLTLET